MAVEGCSTVFVSSIVQGKYKCTLLFKVTKSGRLGTYVMDLVGFNLKHCVTIHTMVRCKTWNVEWNGTMEWNME